MTGISLERFAQVGLGEKVGFAGNDKTSLETRPASKGFCGRVAGWVQNQFTSHRVATGQPTRCAAARSRRRASSPRRRRSTASCST
jgi:hypothetical protein